MYSIEDFRRINKAENIIITLHGQLRLRERKITVEDVIYAIDHGTVIEQYPDDFPFPSCLILGISLHNTFIHVVVSMNEENIYLITAYRPDPNEWEEDWKTRKG